ncbi:unnamed protein product, partial [Closterium sp. NIES-65]
MMGTPTRKAVMAALLAVVVVIAGTHRVFSCARMLICSHSQPAPHTATKAQTWLAHSHLHGRSPNAAHTAPLRAPPTPRVPFPQSQQLLRRRARQP